MANTPFMILKFDTLLNWPGMDLPEEYWQSMFWALTDFLQSNDLTVRVLASNSNEILEDFGLYSDDLTDEGLTFLRKTLDKWMGQQDRGVAPDDVTYLEKQLERMRDK